MNKDLSRHQEALDLGSTPTREEYLAWVAAHDVLPTQDPAYNHHGGDPGMRPSVEVNNGKPIDDETSSAKAKVFEKQ